MFGATSTNSSGGLFGSGKPATSGFGSNMGSNTNTNTGLFGSGNSTSQNTNGFGAQNNATGGSFLGQGGNNSGTGNASGALFGGGGATNNLSSSGGLFGNNNNTTNNSGSATGGGMFGNNQTSSNTNNLFGSNNNKSTSGGLFGNNNTVNNNTNNTGNGLFGSNTSGNVLGANNNISSANGGGLFGIGASNNSAIGGSTGLFSNPSNTSNGAKSGGLFSNSANNNGPSSNSLFGAKTTNTNSFGNASTTNQGSSNLFGNVNNSQNTAGTGLFGSNNAVQNKAGLFGGTNNSNPSNTQGSGIFPSASQSQSNNLNSSQASFGWSNSNQNNALLSNSNSVAPNNELTKLGTNAVSNLSNPNQNYTPAIQDQLIKIKEQWDPNSSKCLLKTHFYNRMTEDQVSAFMNQPRPANELPEDWDNAMSNRPNAQYYPVKVTSFTDVAQRIEIQLEQIAKSRILLNAINEKQTALSSKHDLDNTTRILKAKSRHQKLSKRLLRLATLLAVLRLRGYPLLPEEEELSKQFELLNSKLSDPTGSLGSLSDIFARLAILKERSEDLNYQFETHLRSIEGSNVPENYGALKDKENSNEILNKVSGLLLKQQIGLNHLNEIVEKDLEATEKLVK